MARSARRRAARQHERAQRLEPGVERVDGMLERLDLRRRNAQRRARLFVRLARKAEIGAEIEQVVLDSLQHRLDRDIGRIAPGADRDERKPDRAIGLVDIAHRHNPRVALRPPRAIAEPRLALVACPRIDDVQLDHRFQPALHAPDRADLKSAPWSRLSRREPRVHQEDHARRRCPACSASEPKGRKSIAVFCFELCEQTLSENQNLC
jgi:hypothetical protein